MSASSRISAAHFLLLLLSLLPQCLLGQLYQQSVPSYGLSRYSLGNPYIGQFYGKPSYGYVTPYGAYGLSGYEGPPYGVNTYWQPGVAYPPSYGYGLSGYGTSPIGGYGSSGLCRDRSGDCALLASSGQCASSGSTRALCPLSCGTGCLPNDVYSGGMGSGAYSMLADPYSMANYRGSPPPMATSPLGQPPFGQPQAGGGSFDPFGPASVPMASLMADPGSTPPFFCRDSHIFGCPAWAQQGLCQTVPEFMLNYCRASCGVCGPGGAAGSFKPMGNGMGMPPPPLGNGAANVIGLDSADQLGRGGGATSLSAPQLLPGNAASLSGLYSPYLPYAPYYPLMKSAAALGAERREEKQQQRNSNGGAKLMFSEDELQQDQQLFGAGLSASSSSSSLGQSQQSLMNPSQLLPPSSLSTQHSSVSKLVRMDDLLEGKKQRKM